jgi:hypothetical protein
MLVDNDKTAETDDIKVSAVTSDNEGEHRVTWLPGGVYKVGFDEDQD